MDIDRFTEGLLSFLQASPTPYHTAHTMSVALEQAGFTQLDESQPWPLQEGGSYFVQRNDAAIIAFRYGDPSHSHPGYHMVGAHTDSPCLKLKPNSEIVQHGYFQLGVEVYGGALLHPWFDRDLSIAGRVYYLDAHHRIQKQLIDFEHPIAFIPNLAIHLDRESNQNKSVNAQKHLPPIVFLQNTKHQVSWKTMLNNKLTLSTQNDVSDILDFDLCLYDTQQPRLVGLKKEFIASARLDNLISCYVGLMSLLNSPQNQRCLLVCNDHEEVGSTSASGAQSPFLKDVLKRILPSHEIYNQCLAQSFCISADNAHGLHPNYVDKYDAHHGPIINQGPVIKTNANHRYATTSETSALIHYLAKLTQIDVQQFVVRSDMKCGSTIGPITASELGIRTVDIGVPQFAMHSIRETAGIEDIYALFKLLCAYYNLDVLPV